MWRKSLDGWCCSSFRQSFDNAMHRGLGVLVHEFEDEPLFRIQYRAVDVKDENSLPAIPIPVALASQASIKFCPWCGRHLAKYYRSSWKELIRSGVDSIEY